MSDVTGILKWCFKLAMVVQTEQLPPRFIAFRTR